MFLQLLYITTPPNSLLASQDKILSTAKTLLNSLSLFLFLFLFPSFYSISLLSKGMQRSLVKHLGRKLLVSHGRSQPVVRPCDVFINHRSIDTKRTVAGLLYDHFIHLNLHPFLDSKNMKPGDKLFDHIDSSIRACKIGVAVFSPTYCNSYFCLHELALLMECKKKVIPIFYDVKPSELLGLHEGICPAKDLQRFKWALEEATYTVGLTFDSSSGDWSDFLRSASDIVVKTLIELEAEASQKRFPLATSATSYLS